MSMTDLCKTPRPRAVLDQAHIGDIRGALGTIRHGDIAPRIGWGARWRTLLALIGPGLIVMAGDNDAGAFSTYSQAGQNFGTALLWTLVLLIPVLYVNQEMVLRLEAKHLPRYLGAFAWRFTRRFVLKTIHARLVIAAAAPPPMPYRLLKLAEARW